MYRKHRNKLKHVNGSESTKIQSVGYQMRIMPSDNYTRCSHRLT